MPTYAYRCLQCGRTFECVETMAEHGAVTPACPGCGGQDVAPMPTPFIARTSRKS